MAQDIGIVFEDFFDQIRMLSSQIEDLPVPAALRVTEGAGTGAAETFKKQMTYFAGDLTALAKGIRKELEGVETLMRAAAADLAETDAAAADTARAVLVQLEGIPDAAPTKATPATPAKGTFK